MATLILYLDNYICHFQAQLSSLAWFFSSVICHSYDNTLLGNFNYDSCWPNQNFSEQGFKKGQTPCKFTGWEDEFTCLVCSSRGKFLFSKKSVQKVLPACENLIAILLKMLMKYLFEEHFFVNTHGFCWQITISGIICFIALVGSPFCLMLIDF